MQRDKYRPLSLFAPPCCEDDITVRQLVSVRATLQCRMKPIGPYTKSSARSALTDEHLQAVLRIATTHVAIDFDALVKAKQCQETLNIIMDGSLIAAVLLLRWVDGPS